MDSSETIRQLASSIESEVVRAEDPIRIVPKGWGEERWLVNIPSYCAKILIIESGKKMSWHYHEIKEETFFVLSGTVELLCGSDKDINRAKKIILGKNQRFHIPPKLIHQLVALEQAEILEVSTFHRDSDSFRIQKGD